jgi:type I restriction enzyme S subunit
MKWPLIELGSAAEIRGGATPRRNHAAYWNGEIPWLTPSDLPANRTGITDVAATAEYITDEGLASCSAGLLPVGTVLFSSRASIGKIGIASVPLTTNQGFANLIPRAGLDGRYLAWCLYFHADEIARLAGSTTFKEVSKSSLKGFRVPLPSLSEQRRIVEILDQANSLRCLRAEANAKAERILLALFIEMFGDPATNPMGWPVHHLRELGRPLSGGAFPLNEQGLTEGEVPFIKVSDMNTQGNEWFIRRANNYVSRATLRTLKVKSAPAGTIVFPKIGAAIATNKKRLLVRETAYDNNVIGVVPKDDTFAAYLFGFFQLFDLRSLARSTALPSIKASELARLPVPRPHPEVARAFGDRFLAMAQIRDVTTKAGLVIDALFQNLMHRAFSGSLTASWRQAHLKEALEEMEEQAKAWATG